MKLLVSLLSGAALTLALPGSNWWPFLLALVPLFVLVTEAPHPRRAFIYGFLFGLGFFSLYVFWLPRSFSELFGPASWLIYPPLVLILASFWGLVTWLSRLAGGRGLGALWLLPGLWVLMEWARTQGYFAFPWGTVGYSWLDTPLAQAADIAGVYGLSMLSLVMVSLLAAAWLKPRERSRLSGITAVLLISALWYGGHRLGQVQTPPEYTAILVQGNVDPLGRAQGSSETDLQIYTRLTRTAMTNAQTDVDLVVWPEGTVLSSNLATARGASVRRLIEQSAPGIPTITGAGTPAANGRYNSAFVIDEGLPRDRYDKVYLVPFGERFPFLDELEPLYRSVFGLLGLGLLQGTLPGEAVAPLATGSISAATYICYESVFPQIARRMSGKGANLLVNISNDAWFGRGQGAVQHFEMGRLRAVETRRYLLRAGIDGITAVVDPLGRVVERLPRGVEGSLAAAYGLSEHSSFYVRYGDWLIVLLVIYTVGAIVLIRLRQS